jgi:hypothetical protein
MGVLSEPYYYRLISLGVGADAFARGSACGTTLRDYLAGFASICPWICEAGGGGTTRDNQPIVPKPDGFGADASGTGSCLKREAIVLLSRAMPDDLPSTYARVVGLKRQIRAVRPTVGLLVRRSPLDQLESQLDELAEQVAAAGAAVLQVAVPADLNSKLAVGAAVTINTARYEATSRVVAEAYRDIGDLRNRLDFLSTLLLSLVGLSIAVIALFTG